DNSLIRMLISQSGSEKFPWRTTARVDRRVVLPLRGNTVKMHLIGGVILSALLAIVPTHPAKAADALPQPAPAPDAQAVAPTAPAAPADRLTAPDLEAWLD